MCHHTACIGASSRLLTYLALDLACYLLPSGLLCKIQSTVELPSCPVKLLDKQSGQLSLSRGGGMNRSTTTHHRVYGQSSHPQVKTVGFGDVGGASRFFRTFAPDNDATRFLYHSKPDRPERDLGCDLLAEKTGGELTNRKEGSAGLKNPRAGAGRTSGGKNSHPTVKSIELCRWLCRLITPPGGTVLDPFAGSGSTGCAALREGLRFVGIERSPEYAQIARARIGFVARNR
jgi:hypothetical protein